MKQMIYMNWWKKRNTCSEFRSHDLRVKITIHSFGRRLQWSGHRNLVWRDDVGVPGALPLSYTGWIKLLYAFTWIHKGADALYASVRGWCDCTTRRYRSRARPFNDKEITISWSDRMGQMRNRRCLTSTMEVVCTWVLCLASLRYDDVVL